MNVGRPLFASGLVALMLAPGIAHARVVVDGAAGSEAKKIRTLVESVEKAKRERTAARSKPQETTNGFVWPVVGAINTHFDGGHAGIDIEGLTGDKIIAADSGTVTFAGDDGDGYGVKVIIQHANGYETLYSHLSSLSVTQGPIAQGELVGLVGCTGSCTGDHLHFEILQGGIPTDPLALLP